MTIPIDFIIKKSYIWLYFTRGETFIKTRTRKKWKKIARLKAQQFLSNLEAN